MGFPDISTIDFDSIEVVSVPKKLRDITDLYRAHNYEDADMQLEAYKKLPHHTRRRSRRSLHFSGAISSRRLGILWSITYIWVNGVRAICGRRLPCRCRTHLEDQSRKALRMTV